MTPSPDETRRDALIDRMLESARGTFLLLGAYIGVRLGLYEALAESGTNGLTSGELASRTGTNERYMREWLEQQATARLVDVDDERADDGKRRYTLPPGHREVLVDRESLNYLAPLPRLLVGALKPLPALLDAYRTGGGVPYADYGSDLIEGQAAINRTMFLQQLGQEWIPAIPELHARLQADPPARVADVGCGAGWSSIGLAQSYPKVKVDGFDLDESSIALARGNQQFYGLGRRLEFHVRDAGDPQLAGRYDLVTAFECVHDMSQPVAALRAMRSLAGDEGTVLVVDERVGEEFAVEGNDVDWMMYGWSILHCLPVGKADDPSAETGTVMRPKVLRRYAEQAGFQKVEILPIENFFFRFYRLFP
jgi:2-polyprenyl-3-methyl-5-hydroxy-6-metoxy-1,4-benzoquinol methylase